MYPLCWAVVEGETNASWAWFFVELRKVLDDTGGTNMTLISDEAQAIINGVASVFPKAEHRHCARHVFAHWHSVFKGDEMKELFWKAAKAYNQADYEDALAYME
ncbi:putative galactinol--sucrose galactosyltransferase 2, partial [Bienertia sinuspersici]